MAQSPELLARIAIWRQKALDNTLSLDEMREAITALRGDRLSAAHASEASKRKSAKAAIPSAQDLLSELEGL